MTLPSEEVNSLLAARRFLFDIMNPKATPRVSKEVRERARRIIRHYPFDIIVLEKWKKDIKNKG